MGHKHVTRDSVEEVLTRRKRNSSLYVGLYNSAGYLVTMIRCVVFTIFLFRFFTHPCLRLSAKQNGAQSHGATIAMVFSNTRLGFEYHSQCERCVDMPLSSVTIVMD